MSEKRNILITPALPYANGSIHLGHMVEHLLTDIWSRYFKHRGHNCQFVCADDTHGTPIMLSAKMQGITPEELINRSKKEHIEDFRAFEVLFDNYSSTNSDTNRDISAQIFKSIEKRGHIEQKVIEQAYCEHDKMFLPDRFVKGTCPKCEAAEQYGDGCEICGAVYGTAELKDASCALCGNAPVKKDSEHLFLVLNNFKNYLQEWLPKHTDPAITNKMSEWFDKDLQSWCISRDKPYFGFEIPGHPEKYYYVWFDAPVGYMASYKEWCDSHGKDFETEWNRPDREIYHVIGKDITYHHTLFWPAMLSAAGHQGPTKVLVHGMLNVNGAKMSKSRGTFILARTYCKHLDPSYMRYYMACKLNGGIDDLELNFDDFVARVNSDLIGKITNVASRGAQMLHKLDGTIGTLSPEGLALVHRAQQASTLIAEHYEKTEFSKAVLEIRKIADEANKYFDSYEPWKLIKSDQDKTKEVLTTILNLFRIMAIYLKPILPSYVAKVETLFGDEPYCWDDVQTIVENRKIAAFKHLLSRIDPKKVKAILDETAMMTKATPNSGKTNKGKDTSQEQDTKTISFDDFMKVDLRVAKIIDAQHVSGANKLLQLTLDIGNESRNVFAGIKSAYRPEDLIGRLTVMVANLAPRKMKFGMSEGMILAAGDGKDIFILSPDAGAKPGQRIS